MAEASLPPHVLIFPLPLQGPVNCMIKIAELLCLAGFHITLVATDYVHGRLLRCTNIQSRLNQYPGFRLETLPDGLPEDNPRSVHQLSELFHSLDTVTRPLFKELLSSGRLSSTTRRPVTCIIADGILGFTCDVAVSVGIPIIYIRTISACCLWVCFCLPRLIESGEFPFKGINDLDIPIKSVPGMEGILRRRDLPGFCRMSNHVDDPSIQLYVSESKENSRAYGLILNTFKELEGPAISHIRKSCPNLYNIGPLHALHKTKLRSESTSSNSFFEEDRSCMTWLDAQPLKSVIYVSFGSLAVMTKEQLTELWHGLVNSGKRFLWVIRSTEKTTMDGEGDGIPGELWDSEGRKEKGRGYIVGWGPQEEILAHPSVGGFLTHAGWNSILESIYEGVPMLCWPFFFDQQVNSRYVGEVWKVGLDMKDMGDRVTIEEMIRDLMEVRSDEFQRSAHRMAQIANECVADGGSSPADLERLIQDLRSMI